MVCGVDANKTILHKLACSAVGCLLCQQLTSWFAFVCGGECE